MTDKFIQLTRRNVRNLRPGSKLREHGIEFERLPDGDRKYTLNIMADGVRVHRILGKGSEGVTRKQAEDFIEQTRTDARKGRLNLPEGRKVILGFRDAARKYLAKLEKEGGKDLNRKKERIELHLAPFIKDKPLSSITSFDIERYKKARKEANAANGTVNRELAALSHLFSKAVEWKWINHPPAKINRLKEGSGRIAYLTGPQISRFLEKAAEHQSSFIYPFVKIALETSMRRSEILSIRIQDIDLQRRIIFIPKAKAGAREQPITRNLSEYLAEYLKTTEPGQKWLFPSNRSECGHIKWPEHAFRDVVKAAGLDPKEVVRHTLRHTAITHLVQAGIDLPTVQRISGHKTLQMVARYSHQNGEHIQAAMDQLEKRYKAIV
ncbi:MAG: integrase [Deltaproteobacteria bacterium CG23_combo_of_CG06-09_8_20_14_all_51_20]|nr:site-specific integrase [bacterium]NCP07496.1 site-specific integrase [bacterium]OIP41621.1 MAG: integrase [Desulfobacteraceae bacterium CG2_30_51_40]PIP45914.1 MAG: integrase [Deltaproteobacteria bacterium CG23_combo_of_CG06-09_8_20_14_all_51_20]